MATRSKPDAQAEMERLNREAAKLHIWCRTYANAPAQRPWAEAEAGMAVPPPRASAPLASDQRVQVGQMKAAPHVWRWNEIKPYLTRISELARESETPPIEFADRQQFLLCNPGLNGRIQVASTIRIAVSIYNPGDEAPVHMHTPNASRTILSEEGGYTTVDGERLEAKRGDLLLTPNGTWHDHGNDGTEPVIWFDVLDWPLLEYLDCIWLSTDYPGPRTGRNKEGRIQRPTRAAGYTRRTFGGGGLIARFVPPSRGINAHATALLHFEGKAARAALASLRDEEPSPWEGIVLEFVNPATGGPVFPTLSYTAQLLRAGGETLPCRTTSNTVYMVMEGRGFTEVAGKRLEWSENDVVVVPNFLWRRHVNLDPKKDAVLYGISDAPLMRAIGQYRGQGRKNSGEVVEFAG
jgi:gentisate 1,2-dioxygenase